MSGNRTRPARPTTRADQAGPPRRRAAGIVALALGALVLLGAQSRLPTEAPGAGWLRIIWQRPREKPPVWFSHKLHEDRRIDCRQCHHEWQGKRNLWKQGQPVKQCRTCHDLKAQGRRPDLKNAYHRQCKGCHLKLRQQGRKAGPMECRDCHRET